MNSKNYLATKILNSSTRISWNDIRGLYCTGFQVMIICSFVTSYCLLIYPASKPGVSSSGLWRLWRRLDQACFIGIIRDVTGHRTIHEPRWFFQCYKYQYLNNQSTPASCASCLIQHGGHDGEQTNAHLFVTCQLYSLVRPPQAKQANYVIATAQLVSWLVNSLILHSNVSYRASCRCHFIANSIVSQELRQFTSLQP